MKQTPKHNHKSQQQQVQEQQSVICLPKTEALTKDLALMRRLLGLTNVSDELTTIYLVHTVCHIIFCSLAEKSLEGK